MPVDSGRIAELKAVLGERMSVNETERAAHGRVTLVTSSANRAG